MKTPSLATKKVERRARDLTIPKNAEESRGRIQLLRRSADNNKTQESFGDVKSWTSLVIFALLIVEKTKYLISVLDPKLSNCD